MQGRLRMIGFASGVTQPDGSALLHSRAGPLGRRGRGHIFYGAYVRFFEFAESELFRTVGLSYSRMYDTLDVWLPRVHIECDFHNAARLDDLEVSVQVSYRSFLDSP